jgi:anti-sigma-K factor RskA
MTDTAGPHDEPPDADLTAAEYALGVLDLEARRAAESRSDKDPAFAREVYEWTLRLQSLVDEAPEARPSSALWQRIEAATALAAATPAKVPDPKTRGGPGLWRAWALGASAIAAAALLFIAFGGHLLLPGANTGPAGPSGPTLVATLALKEGGAAAVTVAYDPGRSTIYAAPDADFSIPKARAAELWLIPKDGKPRPVGLIDPSKPATMPMPLAFRALAGETAVLALSIEPSGGSPTGSPTGPVVATGVLSAV